MGGHLPLGVPLGAAARARGPDHRIHEAPDQRTGVIGAPCEGGRYRGHSRAGYEGEARARVVGLGGCRAYADSLAGDDMLSPFVDVACGCADDGLVAAGSWIEQPRVSKTGRPAPVDGRLGGNPRHAGDVRQGEFVASRQRMVGWKHKHAGFLGDGLEFEARCVDGWTDEGHVAASIQEPAGRTSQIKGLQFDLDIGGCLPEHCQKRGRGVTASSHVQTDVQLAAHDVRTIAGSRDPAVQRGERLSGAVQEGLAGGRERHAFVRPFEQLRAHGVFELAYLRAEYLLGHVDAPGGGREACLLGNGYEVPQMPQLNVDRGIVARRDPKFRLPRKADVMNVLVICRTKDGLDRAALAAAVLQEADHLRGCKDVGVLVQAWGPTRSALGTGEVANEAVANEVAENVLSRPPASSTPSSYQ